jgi:ABC-type nitrate/sulfonate/bicarbonate transport system ATPase subunit
MALALNPSVLLLDEPTANFDFVTKRKIQRLIRSLWRGTSISVVLVTHDLDEAIRVARRIICMDKGKIVGTVDLRHLGLEEQETLTGQQILTYRSQLEVFFQ